MAKCTPRILTTPSTRKQNLSLVYDVYWDGLGFGPSSGMSLRVTVCILTQKSIGPIYFFSFPICIIYPSVLVLATRASYSSPGLLQYPLHGAGHIDLGSDGLETCLPPHEGLRAPGEESLLSCRHMMCFWQVKHNLYMVPRAEVVIPPKCLLAPL